MINILDQVLRTPKPMDLASWWSRLEPSETAHPLFGDEKDYLEFFSSEDVEDVLRVRGTANQGNLSDEQRKAAMELFKGAADPLVRFANRENRRRIVSHYVRIHPATIRYELGLYRFSRDATLVGFVAERIYELFSGEEAFTGESASRVGAAAELLVPIVIGRVLRGVRIHAPARAGARPLSDPIYHLPPEGGGMSINGRWYTEHALERMAPDTPELRQEILARIAARLRKLGISEGSPAWDACLARQVGKNLDPRGVPPSVVEAELLRPGSTPVRVVAAKNKTVVITVIPRRRGK